MANNSNRSTASTTQSAQDKADDAPAAKPTAVKDAEGKDVAPADLSTGATDGSRATIDPESDLGKARAIDDDHSGGAIRAEDNAGDGRQIDGAAEASPAGSDPSVGERVNVKCSGAFILQDPYSLDTITEDGGPEGGALRTSFIEDKLASGQLVEA